MRIWDYRLLPYLSDLQFKGQCREIIAIMRDWKYKGTTNHLLINRVMDYPKTELTKYFLLYREEYFKRYGKHISDEYSVEFMHFAPTALYWRDELFKGWHNKEYLRVCMANLYEKHFFGIGKSRIAYEEWERLCEGYKTITGEDYKI